MPSERRTIAGRSTSPAPGPSSRTASASGAGCSTDSSSRVLRVAEQPAVRGRRRRRRRRWSRAAAGRPRSGRAGTACERGRAPRGRNACGVYFATYARYWRINLLTMLEYRANFLMWAGFTVIYHATAIAGAVGHAAQLPVDQRLGLPPDGVHVRALDAGPRPAQHALLHRRQRAGVRPRRPLRPLPRPAARPAVPSADRAAADLAGRADPRDHLLLRRDGVRRRARRLGADRVRAAGRDRRRADRLRASTSRSRRRRSGSPASTRCAGCSCRSSKSSRAIRSRSTSAACGSCSPSCCRSRS